MKLLIVKPSSLGDIIHAMPAVGLLMECLPDAEITWVANDNLASVVSLAAGIRVIRFPRKALGKLSFGALRAFLKDLRQESYDAVLDFQGLLRSALISRFAHAKARYGFANGREGSPHFYTKAVALPAEIRHAAEKNLFLAKSFLQDQGITDFPLECAESKNITVPEAWMEEAAALQKENGLLGKKLLAVGCSSRWNSKSWPVKYFADVLKIVAERRPDVGIWLLGGPDEAQRAESLKDECDLENVVNLAGKTSMGALTAMLHESAGLFTNDSGPMHIAALLGVPCVANFGSTDPTLTGPYGPKGRHFIVASDCPKAPCFCRECPRGDNALCCSNTDRTMVAEEILKRLDARD